MGIAIAIGIHTLDEDDATAGDAAAGYASWAVRGAKPRRGGRGRR